MPNKEIRTKKDELKSDYETAYDFSVKLYREFKTLIKAIALFGSVPKKLKCIFCLICIRNANLAKARDIIGKLWRLNIKKEWRLIEVIQLPHHIFKLTEKLQKLLLKSHIFYSQIKKSTIKSI